MLGPAFAAPLLAWALSGRPASAGPPSGAQLVFAASAGFIVLLALGALWMPRRLTNKANDPAAAGSPSRSRRVKQKVVELVRPASRFGRLEEE